MRTQQFDTLTGLRFLAAIAVVFYHFRDRYECVAIFCGIIERSHTGVDFFFVLSGFILTLVYADAYNSGGFSYSRFVGYRFARIYPLHLLTLGGYLAVFFLGYVVNVPPRNSDRYAFEDLPFQFALVHAWGILPKATWNTPSWSISAEWFVYLIFPAVCFIGLRLIRNPAFGTFMSVCLFFGAEWISRVVNGTSITEQGAQFAILRIVPEFLLGHYLFLLVREVRRVSAGCGRTIAAAAGFIVIIGFAFDVLPPAGAVPLFALVICGLYVAEAREPAGRGRWAAVCRYLGEISYSVYMVHMLVYTVYFQGADILAEDKAGGAVWVLPAVGVVLFVAVLTYHLVEVPSRRVLRAAVDRVNVLTARQY